MFSLQPLENKRLRQDTPSSLDIVAELDRWIQSALEGRAPIDAPMAQRARDEIVALRREGGEDVMPVMMPEVTVWAEEGGIELRAVPHSGTVEISIIKDGKIAATATVARYRWDRVWQAVLPPPPE